jgi:hypothetical protein
MRKHIQHVINPSKEFVQSFTNSDILRLIYYLYCVKKIDNTLLIPEELFYFEKQNQIDLTQKQEILAYSFKYSPDIFLNRTAFLIKENDSSQTDHYFKEDLLVELDHELNLKKTSKSVQLFFKIEWLQIFYFRPIEQLSSNIKELNQKFDARNNKKVETFIG